ncbi:ribosomal protein S12 methylthiotransferase rimO [Alloprevotella rava F0323]|uniref:Ribosomal protein uS12 methylthiotransferase RimO n=1 Tax=Alloprevotella rava F0323 TaxID=679199 RepID=G5G9P9_9BACT|nr:30S ribosomal protein S12 methylthiotransferase RimO [Alloprevotella rava]EHG24099.1 ribosomal protein S12 methylthiotransferase rimO [Alloprevotella rava F0323]
MNIDIITMGCSKNLVDSERLMNQFAEHGFKAYHNPNETHGDIAVINTCGFITSAKEESINMILNLCNQKDAGTLEKVFVMGCLSERYMDELKAEIPQVDKFYGKFNWKDLLKDLQSGYNTQTLGERVLTTPSHYAYIKIAEGCNRMCAYCAIPLITGRHVSRPKEEILDEVRGLVIQGVKEFQVIEQELTYYGIDLYNKPMISELVDEMAKIPGVEWIRLHYAYPNDFPLDLLRVIKENSNVCNYLDIALQHISDNVLQRMRRHVTKQETLDLIKKMREEVPNLCIRTTLLVGFPGETEEDFKELYDFVRDTRFDRMGVFAYSEEEGTFAALHYEDDIPEEIKQERVDKLMELQMKISTELNTEKVGKTYKTIIDRQEGEFFIGRTEFDSPEVDCEVLIPATEELMIGEFYNVDIVDSDEYDLYGTTQK